MVLIRRPVTFVTLAVALCPAGCGAHRGAASTHRARPTTGDTVRFLPGGERIVRDELQPGWSFRFIGELYQQGSQRHFYVVLQNPTRGPLGTDGAESLVPQGTQTVLPYTIQQGCQPHPWTILYGLLQASDDTVTARTGTDTRGFRKVRVPRALNARGVLAYATLGHIPDEVRVSTPSGDTVLDENLGGDPAGPCQAGSISVGIPIRQVSASRSSDRRWADRLSTCGSSGTLSGSWLPASGCSSATRWRRCSASSSS